MTKKYCDNMNCPLECTKHPKHIPKDQKEAILVNWSGVCRRYISWLLSDLKDKY